MKHDFTPSTAVVRQGCCKMRKEHNKHIPRTTWKPRSPEFRLLFELIHLIVSTFSPAFKILSPTHAVFISCQDNQPFASGRDQDPGFLPQRPRRDHRGLVACSDVWSTSCESDLGLQSLGCSRFYFCLIFVVFLNICVGVCFLSWREC